MGDVRQTVKQSLPVDVGKPYDPTTLKDKTILITGGANGLGAHMVRHWASHGANIIIGDVANAAGEELVASLRTAYPNAVFEFQDCDVTDWASQSHYTASKHAVLGLFRSLRGTAFMKGIRVNMIAPYYTAQTNMLPPVAEALLLAGSAGPGSVPDVIDAATRLIADESVVGRALVIGPRLRTPSIDMGCNMMQEEDNGQSQAVWECYAHDYDQVETFVKRYLWLLNATARARGMFAWIRDVLAIWRRG